MELIKRNIHMDRLKCKASTQITLEDDINISDTRPDASALIMDKGNVVIEDVKVTDDHVTVKGILAVHVLYLVDGKAGDVAGMEASLPFEEQIYAEGVESTDTVDISWEVEDLSVGLINSRKIGVQSLLVLTAICEEVCDEETAVDIACSKPLEFRKKTLDIAAMALKKKDIFRIKEEVEIPGSFPNIFSLIFWDVTPAEVDFKMSADKINIQGEMRAFFLYRGEGEDEEICHYETMLPFAGSIECPGAQEGMIPEIRYRAETKEVTVRPDFDGEDRVITFESCLYLDMNAYEEEKVEILSDVYSVVSEVTVDEKDATFRKLFSRNTGKMKLSEHLDARAGAQITKILHTVGAVQITEQILTEEGVVIEGYISLQILYESSREEECYGMIKETLPFRHVMETEYKKNNYITPVQADVEQITATVLGGEEIDVKCVLFFRVNVYTQWNEKIIEQITERELDSEKMAALPGIAIYMVGEGESLWDIGKRYYVPVSVLKQTNELSSDEVKCGDRILIVKSR